MQDIKYSKIHLRIFHNSFAKQYISGRGHVQALSGITFQVEKGTNLALVGKSGSGKTTLMNCIGGIEKPDTGKVAIAGFVIA